MKVVVRSSSLLFTVLSIVFNVPITRVQPAPTGPLEKPADGNPSGASKGRYRPVS